MVFQWLLYLSTVSFLLQWPAAEEAKVPSSCTSGSQCASLEETSPSFAELFLTEDENEGPSLNLLQRRQRQRVKEHHEADKANQQEEDAAWPPPPFSFEEADVSAYASALNDDDDSHPPPLTPIVIPQHRKRHSLDLHFDAVMTSCGSRVSSDPSRCDKAVVKSAHSIFVQLHVKARIEEKVAPLNKEETHHFRARFQELVVGDSKRVILKKTRSEQYKGWKNLVSKGYMTMRPVVPAALVRYVNDESKSGSLSWSAEYDKSFVKVPVAVGKTRLGFVMSNEEAEEMKNHTASMLQQDLEEIGEEELKQDAYNFEFDVREHWPECKPVSGHVRYQTCNNCWSHSTALITESRLCIQSHGKFNGGNAWLSQSYIAACRMDGQNYCRGGSGLLGFKTVSRWGVPTGGPDFRGNMQAGVETCYPQILPHENNVRCPGACSPYSHYRRQLQQDLFYVQYQPRALHPQGTQTPYLVKRALMQEGPILLGMRIYQDFYAYKNGIYRPARKSWNRYMGGHAVTGMGFGPGYVLAINSWSTAWGIRGSFQVAPESIDFGYFLPGHPFGSHGANSWPDLLPM